jgi:hypothetical protein
MTFFAAPTPDPMQAAHDDDESDEPDSGLDDIQLPPGPPPGGADSDDDDDAPSLSPDFVPPLPQGELFPLLEFISLMSRLRPDTPKRRLGPWIHATDGHTTNDPTSSSTTRSRFHSTSSHPWHPTPTLWLPTTTTTDRNTPSTTTRVFRGRHRSGSSQHACTQCIRKSSIGGYPPSTLWVPQLSTKPPSTTTTTASLTARVP